MPGGGRACCEKWGFGPVADLVATHMDITVDEREPVTAGEVIYLADKLVRGEQRVPLVERFNDAMKRHAHDPAVTGRIAGRLETAMVIQKRMEGVLGHSLIEVIDM